MRLVIEVVHFKKNKFIREKSLIEKKTDLPVKTTLRPVVRVLLKAYCLRFPKDDLILSPIAAEKTE